MAANSQTKPIDLGCESIGRLLPYASPFCYYCSVRKLILIYSFAQPVPKAAVVINTTVSGVI